MKKKKKTDPAPGSLLSCQTYLLNDKAWALVGCSMELCDCTTFRQFRNKCTSLDHHTESKYYIHLIYHSDPKTFWKSANQCILSLMMAF